jgi:hypothetical protein
LNISLIFVQSDRISTLGSNINFCPKPNPTVTVLLADDDINDANDTNNADDINNANDANDADINNADDERRRRSSIEKRKESRLNTSLDRVERLVMCCFFALLAVNQGKFISEFAFSKS